MLLYGIETFSLWVATGVQLNKVYKSIKLDEAKLHIDMRFPLLCGVGHDSSTQPHLMICL